MVETEIGWRLERVSVAGCRLGSESRNPSLTLRGIATCSLSSAFVCSTASSRNPSGPFGGLRLNNICNFLRAADHRVGIQVGPFGGLRHDDEGGWIKTRRLGWRRPARAGRRFPGTGPRRAAQARHRCECCLTNAFPNLRLEFSDLDVSTVSAQGWSGTTNGQLLRRAASHAMS